MKMNEIVLINKLQELGIKYSIMEHEPITTMEQGLNIMNKINGCVPVNLLLKDKNKNYYLFIKSLTRNIKINDLSKILKINGLTMAKNDELKTVLDVSIGCVTLFGIMKDPKIKILLDKTIESDDITFHPFRNNASMTIKREDMFKFITACGNVYQFV